MLALTLRPDCMCDINVTDGIQSLVPLVTLRAEVWTVQNMYENAQAGNRLFKSNGLGALPPTVTPPYTHVTKANTTNKHIIYTIINIMIHCKQIIIISIITCIIITD